MNTRRFLLGTATAALVAFVLAPTGKVRDLPQDGAEWFTNVPVQTQDGRTLRFYDDVIKGKILLINFFFSQCDAVCPLATGPRWLFLTGNKDDIELLHHRLGFVDIDPVVDADPEQHLGIANEPMHLWAMSPALGRPEAMVRTCTG